MAPSPAADLQGQTAPCSQAALEDEFAESALHVKGEEGVCLLCGALVLQTHHLLWPSEILLHDGAHHQLQGAVPRVGSRAGCPRQPPLHHMAP